MESLNPGSWLLALKAASEARTPAGLGPTWEALERFVEALQASDRLEHQRRLMLDLVRDATAADAAFLYSAEEEVLAISGMQAPPPVDCRRIAREMLGIEGGPSGSRLYRPTRAATGPIARFGGGAAMVRLGRSASFWVVALACDPQRPLGPADLRLILLAGRLLAERVRQARADGHLRDAFLGLVRGLSMAVDARDPLTLGHSERVGRIASILARRLGLPDSQAGDLYVAGLLHDIGNINVSDAILCKAGPLTDEERAQNSRHPVLGERIVAGIRPLAYLRPGVRHHHERFDGAGYPDGLAGDAIPTMARILAVADACDALTSPRRYRGALDPAQVEAVLTRGAGSQWDPRVVGAFLDARQEVFQVASDGLGSTMTP